MPTTLVLFDSQVASLKIETFGTSRSRIEKDRIETIDFDEDLALAGCRNLRWQI